MVTFSYIQIKKQTNDVPTTL